MDSIMKFIGLKISDIVSCYFGCELNGIECNGLCVSCVL